MRELKSAALIAFTVGCALVPAACAPSPAAQTAFDQYVGKTCTGFIPYERTPGDYTGRKIPVVLKFFRTSDGGPHISSSYEGRDFVDHPVSLRDEGLNFIGQFAGVWTFNYESPNHLSGQFYSRNQADWTGWGEFSRRTDSHPSG
jgi:hypothetical protein